MPRKPWVETHGYHQASLRDIIMASLRDVLQTPFLSVANLVPRLELRVKSREPNTRSRL